MATDTRARVTLRTMEQFVAVAEELHFHRAAERLNMSQPPLTSAIRKLEEDIDVILIERANRVLRLTPAGEKFLEEARETLRQAERAIMGTQDVAAGRTGLVRLGYVGSSLYGRLPDAIRTFRRQYPEVRLELREATTAAQVAAIRAGEMDVGVVIPPLSNAEDVEMSRFDSDRLCMAIPKDHPLGNQAGLTLPELSDEPFILWPMLEGRGFHLQVIRLCANAGFVPRVEQEAYGMHAVLSLVAVGAGVSVVPESMSGFRGDRITYRSIPDAGAEFELSLVYRDLSPSAESFVWHATGEERSRGLSTASSSASGARYPGC
ncbi:MULTISPECIES: LysR family transcriptional regulator [unclassified Modicisalibacter]|uniref:LysR family transcriptional regulator n=1 Tax=unclassified Modicisalibacter TaxID=2679913 RepID=UPI001CCE7012|nr:MULTISPECIES: LysR family transcriptional regulator [unclassified Modicisalibacter]MBZ9559712.1 LysR family transcriptional regulator [Modicisalibacter sp. R2A 31.J]MBZ9577164.1 LysR family transcriptional regulator [Modicisalibacter sp. MOD 31.J]